MKEEPQTFPTSKLNLKPYHGAFSANLKSFFLRKMRFCFHPFQPRTTFFGLLKGSFWPKTQKIKCFQFIQSKIWNPKEAPKKQQYVCMTQFFIAFAQKLAQSKKNQHCYDGNEGAFFRLCLVKQFEKVTQCNNLPKKITLQDNLGFQ